jgi:1,4-dihydroxy-6-naphthoate synthase
LTACRQFFNFQRPYFVKKWERSPFLGGKRMEIRVAHSPDSDDAFMFYALATGQLETGDLHFTHILEDIESLNGKAQKGQYEVTAVSIHAYPYIADKYALLSSGASMGDRYGPLIVARENLADLAGKKVAVPGKLTTAFLVSRLFHDGFEPIVVPFDRIMAAVTGGEADAGVLIHEGQLTYAREGLKKIVDLGEWWHEQTGLPLPLGGNAIRRDLGMDRILQISGLIRRSVQYALAHREEALLHAMQYARDLDRGDADRFVGMYVNDRTIDYGEDGRRAVQLLLDMAAEKKLIPSKINVQFI